jgi:hypothetical protein
MCSPIVYWYCYCTFNNLYVGFPFFYACSFICATSGSLVPCMDVKNFFFKHLESHCYIITSRCYVCMYCFYCVINFHWGKPCKQEKRMEYGIRVVITIHTHIATWRYNITMTFKMFNSRKKVNAVPSLYSVLAVHMS